MLKLELSINPDKCHGKIYDSKCYENCEEPLEGIVDDVRMMSRTGASVEVDLCDDTLQAADHACRRCTYQAFRVERAPY